MKVIIEASNLTKSYANKVMAVKNVSFQVREGECFGLLGPNGAGKTSIFKMIYGSAEITSGELFILSLNAKKHMQKIKSLIGVVPQENGLDPDFSALDNLLVYARYFGIRGPKALSRAMDLLAMVQLESHAEKKIEELSGGMKRRLVLARALLSQPKIIFLDEPSTGLDPQAREWIWEELRSLQKKGTTLFLTTHYMEEAENLCSRIAIMNGGKIVGEGAPRELIKNHVGSEVIEFEIGARDVDYYSKKINSKYRRLVSRDRLKVFVNNQNEAKELLQDVQNYNVTIRKASLNDVFLQMSGQELHD